MLDLGAKVQFVNELVENVRRDLIRDCEKWPEEWDGHELRRLIARQFQQAVIGSWPLGRARAFENECRVRGLP
jgi:hypothetical protein